MTPIIAVSCLLVIICVTIGYLVNVMPASSTPSTQAEKPGLTKEEFQLRTQKLAAYVDAKALRKSMRDPDSFRLDSVLAMPDDTMCFEFHSRNGFGGMNSMYAVEHNDKFLTNEQEGATRMWNRYCAKKTGTDLTWDTNYYLEHLGGQQ